LIDFGTEQMADHRVTSAERSGASRARFPIFSLVSGAHPLEAPPVSYTVFARKYRPQTFDEIVGQDHITRTLKNAIEQNRLAHAYIFVGPRGTGKTSTARILAKALNCIQGPTVRPCGICDPCKEIAAGNSMDVLEFDAASNTQVDKIREIIIENVKYAPSHGRYKLYIVDEVHMLSASSFNALLKTLEEPPAHVKFVFATTDPQKVPTTILSRCQRFDLKRIPTALVRDHLLMIAGKEQLALTPAAAEAVARGAEGGMRDAESMLDQLVAFCGAKIEEPDVLRVFGFTAQQTIAQLCAHLLAHDASAALRLVHLEGEAGRDLMRLLADLISHLRNLLVAKADPSALEQELSAEAAAVVVEQAARIDMGRLLDLIEQFAATEGRMKWAPNKKMHLEVGVIRAIQTLSQATLSEVLDALAAMRTGLPTPIAGGSAPPPQRAGAAAVLKSAALSPDRAEPAQLPAIAPANPGKSPSASSEPTPARATSEPDLAIQQGTAPLAPANPPQNKEVAPAIPAPSPPAPPPDPIALWHAVIARIRKERPLLTSSVEAAMLLEITGDTAIIAFPPENALAVELLESPNNRKFTEALLAELTGRPLGIKCVKRAGLKVTEVPREPEPLRAPAADPAGEFKNDPLIRRALDLFRAEIQSV
jgi:DNA polymerase-3 subunit gamma/tau